MMLRSAALVGAGTILLSLLLTAGCGGDDDVEFGADGGASGAATGGGGASGRAGSGGASGAAQGGASGSAQGGASGGGTAGVGTGGAAGSSGTAGVGGAPGPEDCVNGIDDNGDGFADCADPQCEPGFTCAPALPDGWQAIGWIDTQPGASCPAGFEPGRDLYEASTLTADAPTCACECGAPEGVGCATHLYCNGGSSCSSSAPARGVSSTCSTISAPANTDTNACRADKPQAGGGQCTAKATASFGQPVWAPTQRACGVSASGSCTKAGEVCVPKMPGGTGPCIAKAGDVDCPSNRYTEKTLLFDGQVADNRSCDAGSCQCSVPEGGSCTCGSNGCQVQVFVVDSCGLAASATVPANGTTCRTFNDYGNLNGQWGIQLAGTTLTSAGACAASGSATPLGTVTPSGPVTFCCVP